MKDLINNFIENLEDAIRIGEQTVIPSSTTSFQNIVILGMGGSGIGGSIVSQILQDQLSIPVIANKDYSLPAFVGDKSLVIANSYSGNTEETLMALKEVFKTNATLVAICSGGELASLSEEKDFGRYVIPGGMPPRAALGYSFPQFFYALNHFGLINDSFKTDFKNAISLLKEEQADIINRAEEVARELHNKIPIIYSDAMYEGVGIRLRQQINENAKMLCWHHVLPEMNHNELVGWRAKSDDLAVVIFRNSDDHPRTQVRMELTKEIISAYCDHIIEMPSKGKSRIERSLYLIHLGDWVSYFLAEIRQIDAVEVNVISYLKGELAKHK